MMKKLLSIATLLLVSMPALLAQSFEFRYHGESLADGSTVTIAAEENVFGELACETNPSSDPNNGLILKLLSGNTIEGSATMAISNNTLNPENLLWCMGGSCMDVSNNTLIVKSFDFKDGICRVQFDAVEIQSEGYLFATLSATVGTETHTVNIKFTNGDQGDDASFEFRYQGEPLADGATVTIFAEEDDEGIISCVTNPSSDSNNGLILQLLSGNFSGGVATLTINENNFLYENLYWGMSGSSVDFGSNTSLTTTFQLINNIARVLLECFDIQSEGDLSATLVASIGGVNRTVNIKFIFSEQGTPIAGDVNGDGQLTASDVTALYELMLYNNSSHIVNGDQTGDGIITAADVTAVYKILLGND